MYACDWYGDHDYYGDHDNDDDRDDDYDYGDHDDYDDYGDSHLLYALDWSGLGSSSAGFTAFAAVVIKMMFI